MSDVVVVYRDRALRWRWHVKATNGRIVAGPQQSYLTKWNAKRSARRNFPGLPIEEKR